MSKWHDDDERYTRERARRLEERRGELHDSLLGERAALRVRMEPIDFDAPGYDAPSESKPTNPKDAIATFKLPLHLVSPLVKAYQAIAHYLGNVKYGAWNYRGAGIRYSIYYSALHRHMDAWWEGEELDPVDGTPHLANALACINIIIEGKHAGNAVDDRPPSNARELSKVRAEFERLMEKIYQKYGDRTPRHFTIADSAMMERERVQVDKVDIEADARRIVGPSLAEALNLSARMARERERVR
jgi:hypothetical protein